MVVEYLKNILSTNRHIKVACIAEIFNQTGLWFGVNGVLKMGGVILYQSYL